jgi:hypothetical protein
MAGRGRCPRYPGDATVEASGSGGTACVGSSRAAINADNAGVVHDDVPVAKM